MVQAILAGRKTQTRRVVKPQPPKDYDYNGTDTDNSSGKPVFYAGWEGDKFHNVACPYGKVGDVLWVRETWQETTFLHPSDENYGYIYKASEDGKEWESNDESWTWKPSIHMPKAACRLFLEITSIRVERLHEISDNDAKAEGVKADLFTDHPKGVFYTAFMELWQSINGEQSWNDNPWVWVIEFKKIDKP